MPVLTGELLLILLFLFLEAPCDGLIAKRERFCLECLGAKCILLLVSFVCNFAMLYVASHTQIVIDVSVAH